MAATQEMSIVTEVIKEVESYLPDMTAFLRALDGDITTHDEEGEKELYRMTHTIKGAAAMVQLDELSGSAALMEDVLDDILAGERLWDGPLIAVMNDIVDRIGSYCTALHKGEADSIELYHATCGAFEGVEASFSLPSAEEADLSREEGDLLALLGGNEDEESDADFFQQFSDEEENAQPEDELELFPGCPVEESEDIGLDALLGGESDELEGFTPDPAAEESFSLPEVSIDQELQESFDEEAEEHLDNISRQLNELSSSVSERTPVTDLFRERLHSIRRSVHTLKGAAAVIGIESVAEWGHDFEDFLDSLHDESDTISPESISAMQDGADILEKIAVNPAVDVSAEISILQNIFPNIMAGASNSEKNIVEEHLLSPAAEVESVEPVFEQDGFEDLDEQSGKESVLQGAVDKSGPEQPTAIDLPRQHLFRSRKVDGGEKIAPVRGRRGAKDQRTKTRQKTLRVGREKIANLMGLSGDMTINLSSFEKPSLSMRSGLDEFEMTLQRLKGIVSSLEDGYEQGTLVSPGTGSGSAQGKKGSTDEFDPLEMDHYSELYVLFNALHEAVVDLDSIRTQTFSGAHDSWQQAIATQRRIVGEVQGAVQSIQMTPFSVLANRLYKTVRESARATEKQVRLLIEGGSMEMDSHIWNVLADALMHMLRNCVDHGVEPIAERQLAGKPEQATIRINCSRRGSRFVLRLSDDGAGLDYEAIRNRARTLYPDTDVEQMDDKQLAALIFKQGFSIRSKVTSISGRGVGMDVVRTALDQLDGVIEVYSHLGQGTDFVLSMPIAVAQLPALIVMFGKQKYAVPMRDVNSVLRLSAEEMKSNTLKVDDESFPLLRPAELLLMKQSGTVREKVSQDSSLALAVETFGKRGVLVADAIIGQKNVVFKSLGSHLQNIPCVAGATILGDGSLVPILQTEDLFSLVETAAQQSGTHIQEISGEEKIQEILIADDSISIRKVLANFITAQGWQPTTAHDGVDAINKIKERKPDLILLDIEMPRMNGFEVLQTLQSQSAYRDIPVLMLTSRSAAKYREKAAELGARGFVTKPFKDEELASRISALTARNTAEGSGQ